MEDRELVEARLQNLYYLAGRLTPTQEEMDRVISLQRKAYLKLSLVVAATSTLGTLAAGAIVGAIMGVSVLGMAGAFLAARLALSYNPNDELKKGFAEIDKDIFGKALKMAPMDPEVESLYESLKPRSDGNRNDRNMPQA